MSPTDDPTGFGLSAEDEQLLAHLSAVLDLADPVPAHLAARTRFAMDLDDLEFEVATWSRADELVGVRGAAAPNTITFTVGDLTVMVSLAPAANGNRFDGWLVPGGPHRIEVRVDGHETSTTDADDGGRFALQEVPKGITQIVVHLAGQGGQDARTVVTPTIVL
ncbi:MAG TPA: carboxypeptidase regulatory-like domain-containing protein [Pseudonocardiaceae bacterium]|nr:carboxypeptidase regulatory-like domain-containing protein [Pseudonocardiaceae bacterium]